MDSLVGDYLLFLFFIWVIHNYSISKDEFCDVTLSDTYTAVGHSLHTLLGFLKPFLIMVKGIELYIYMQYSRNVWVFFSSKNRGSWKMCQSLEIPSYLPHPASVKETVHLLYNYRMINSTISITKRKDLPMRSVVLVFISFKLPGCC